MGAVLSLGSINLDLQVRAERFPSESETVLGEAFLRAGGGKGANRALLAARLGARAHLIGRVGDDAFAPLALEALRAARVGLEGVVAQRGEATGTSMIVVRADGDKTIVLAPNANVRWEEGAEHDVARRVKEAGAGTVLAVDLEVPPAIVRAALTAARSAGLTTVLDPSPADRMTDDLYALTDYLTPNPRETEHLTGSRVRHAEDAIGAARTLIAAGARSACVKLPDGGALLMGAGAPQLVHAPKVQVVDKTGAGDAFAGALAVALAKARSPRDAVDYAVLASTYAVTVYGSQAAYPTADALARFAVANA